MSAPTSHGRYGGHEIGAVLTLEGESGPIFVFKGVNNVIL
jgi:hypothetical protein